jgi:hypothetical protein
MNDDTAKEIKSVMQETEEMIKELRKLISKNEEIGPGFKMRVIILRVKTI